MTSSGSALFIVFFGVSLLPPTSGVIFKYEEEVLYLACDVMQEILKAAPQRRSSVILITDGTPSTTAIHKVIDVLDPSWGASVFEVVTDRSSRDLNETRDQLSYIIAEARRLRTSSWDVTLLVASDNYEFLMTFADVCDEGRLLVWSTRLLIVTALSPSELQHLLEEYWVLSMMNSMVIHLQGVSSQDQKKFKVVAHLPYRPKGKNNVVEVGTWTTENGLILSTLHQLFPDKHSNFYGSPMNVTLWPFMPYFMSLEEVTGDSRLSDTYTGRDYIMLETMATILNFTINILPTASWDEMMLKVIQRESFMSPMKMSILPHLLEVMDFSIAYESETLTFTMSKPKLKPRWQNLYYPLTDYVWLSTFSCLVLMPFLLFHINRLSSDGETSKNWSGSWAAIREVFATFFGQPLSPKFPARDSFRILVATWLLFSYIIGTGYRANLTAFLTLPKFPHRIETLKQFIDAESIMLIPPDTVDFYNGFKQSPPGDLRTLSERMFFVPDIRAGFPRVGTENAGYMYERRNMELNIARYYTNDDGWTPFYVAKDNIWPGSSAWPIIKDAPFKPILDRNMRLFVEAGLLEKWDNDIVELFNRATRENKRREEENAKTEEKGQTENSVSGNGVKNDKFDIGNGGDVGGGTKPLTVTHLQGPLLLLSFSLLFSVMIFIGEIFLGKVK